MEKLMIWALGKMHLMDSVFWGFPGGSDSKESAYYVGDPDSIPGLGRSPGEGNGNPFQYSCLEISRERGAWWAIVHGVAKSQTRLSDQHFHFLFTWLQLERKTRHNRSGPFESPCWRPKAQNYWGGVCVCVYDDTLSWWLTCQQGGQKPE